MNESDRVNLNENIDGYPGHDTGMYEVNEMKSVMTPHTSSEGKGSEMRSKLNVVSFFATHYSIPIILY